MPVTQREIRRLQALVISLGDGLSFSAVWTAILQTLWSLPMAVLAYFPPARWIE